jgi:hypothetical protein
MYLGQYTLNLDLIGKLSMEQLLELNLAVATEFKHRLAKSPFEEKAAETPVTPVAVPLTREDVVERAKQSIRKLKINGYYRVGWAAANAEFHVNKEKRAVTVLLKGFQSGKVLGKAVAKCDPQDCFNEHIGKAIALHRALKQEIPEIYTNTPQPTKSQIGDRVEYKGKVLTIAQEWIPRETAQPYSEVAKYGKVVDDSARY